MSSTYDVYIGKHKIIEACPKEDLDHKMTFVKEYFDWYRDDDLCKEKIRIVPCEQG